MSTLITTMPGDIRELPALEFPFMVMPAVYAPERTILKLGNGRLVFPHCWCYLQRAVRHSHTEIDTDSLSQARLAAMPGAIERLSELFRFEASRPRTVFKFFGIISRFLNWADAPEHDRRFENVLTHADCALEALKGHHSYLRQHLQAHQCELSTASRSDQSVIKAMTAIHDRTFRNEIEPLSRTSRGTTVAPREDQVATFMSTAQAVFDSAARLVLKQSGDPSSTRTERYELRLSSADDSKIYLLPETYSYPRLMELCAVAFAALAIGDSGANLAQIQGYEEPDDLQDQLSDPARINLTQRQIKFRAAGKLVPVHLTSTTLSRINVYLQVRERLRLRLDCDDISPMFVQCAYSTISKGQKVREPKALRPLDDSFLGTLRTKFQRAGATLPPISLRQLRSYKQQDIARKRGISVAAEVLGTSIATAVRAYCNSQEDVRRSEMGRFLSSLSARALETIGTESCDTVGIPPGSCRDYGNPAAIESNSLVEPDCAKPTKGCLFCKHFGVHADAMDCRKLLSNRYVLIRLAPLNGESAAADRVQQALVDRIDWWIGAIKARIPQVVEDVRRDVDERGNLTVYWAAKLQQLFLLGVLPPKS